MQRKGISTGSDKRNLHPFGVNNVPNLIHFGTDCSQNFTGSAQKFSSKILGTTWIPKVAPWPPFSSNLVHFGQFCPPPPTWAHFGYPGPQFGARGSRSVPKLQHGSTTHAPLKNKMVDTFFLKIKSKYFRSMGIFVFRRIPGMINNVCHRVTNIAR